jgi:hypothetical protein
MQATAPQVSHSARLLQEYLEQDIVPREMSIARFMRGVMLLGCVLAFLMAPAIGWGLSLSLAGLAASGEMLQQQLMALTSPEAPLPHGRRRLFGLVTRAMAQSSPSSAHMP